MLPSSETSWASSCSASSPKLLAKPRQTSSPSLLCSSSVFGLALFVFSSFSQSPPASSKSPTHSLKNGFPTASLPQPLSSFQTFLASPPSLSQRSLLRDFRWFSPEKVSALSQRCSLMWCLP